MDQLKFNVISILSRAKFKGEEDAAAVNEQLPKFDDVELKHQESSVFKATSNQSDSGRKEPMKSTFIREDKKVGRNEPCPCGSGKKYKKCHGIPQ